MNKYLVYDIDKDEKIASTIDFDKEAIEKIKFIFM
jgi:hypothetical protein